jgi:hypothetical protein
MLTESVWQDCGPSPSPIDSPIPVPKEVPSRLVSSAELLLESDRPILRKRGQEEEDTDLAHEVSNQAQY